ncbi:BZ3500_MvSof-1268-A1-R1_Chr4-2g07153 [Microbotryum saponariae]|uniref:BZ3500_MvSof-1268-A1-R1_Chr4-2g07153 protein n=1 Tax=Microbotryum saponariae TaxID=289078 RepID=A0A2X0KW51_9BASI|nr:BZ3500_MvSof-1268-A1-R1_Chr4-2g07153 [Microbotryum saponariae]SDA06818.1 BZ3501_MvSof-1269-A2-R1_Chr4-2g06864 [Microbotryum saponariae]
MPPRIRSLTPESDDDDDVSMMTSSSPQRKPTTPADGPATRPPVASTVTATSAATAGITLPQTHDDDDDELSSLQSSAEEDEEEEEDDVEDDEDKQVSPATSRSRKTVPQYKDDDEASTSSEEEDQLDDDDDDDQDGAAYSDDDEEDELFDEEEEEFARARNAAGGSRSRASSTIKSSPAKVTGAGMKIKFKLGGGAGASASASPSGGRATVLSGGGGKAKKGGSSSKSSKSKGKKRAHDDISDISDDDAGDPSFSDGSSVNSGSRLTARQRAKEMGGEHGMELESLSNDIIPRNKVKLTDAEAALRRSENLRKRRSQAYKKLDDEKTETINRLLKKQVGRQNNRGGKASAKNAGQPNNLSHADAVGPRTPGATLEAARPPTGLRWVSSIKTGEFKNVLMLPVGIVEGFGADPKVFKGYPGPRPPPQSRDLRQLDKTAPASVQPVA